MPLIDRTIELAKAGIATKAHTAIREGKMTPELAMSLWHEHQAADGLLRKLNQKLRESQAAGRRVSSVLTGPPRAP